MAILKNGINGPFSGRVGNVVGYQLNGQNIIRSLPVRTKRKPSKKVLLNRARMKATSQFLSPIKEIIAFGYKNLAPPGSRIGAFQQAQSYIVKNAIDYDGQENPYVNPEAVLVFRGEMVPPIQLQMSREENTLSFTWDVDSLLQRDGQFLALAYVIETNHFWFYDGGTKASDGMLSWDLGIGASGLDQIHVYVGFYDLIEDQFSDSLYAGVV